MNTDHTHRTDKQPCSEPPQYQAAVKASEPTTADAPPDYETAVGATTTSKEGDSSTQVESPGATILTIEGRYITSSVASQEPLYSLTHELDGYELNKTGILLTRIEQNPVRVSGGKSVTKTKRRDVFALRDASPLRLGQANYEIDGERCLSRKIGYMRKNITRSGQGWTAGGKGLPSFVLRPAKPPSGGEGSVYEWRDKKDDKLIAIETRRSWDKNANVESTPPKLELRSSDSIEKEYLDFLVAAWCMHNWREAKDLTKESLTWEEFKDQAKTTARKSRSRRWNLGPGGFAAAAF